MGSGLVPEMWDPGEYREGNIRVSTGKGGSRRVPEMWDLGVSRLESRPDPIGGSEPVSGTRDSGLGLFT